MSIIENQINFNDPIEMSKLLNKDKKDEFEHILSGKD